MNESDQKLLGRLERGLLLTDGGRFTTFTRAEEEAITTMLARMADKPSEFPAWAPEDNDMARRCLVCRYLRDTSLNVDKAIRKFNKAQRIRREYAVSSLTCAAVEDTLRKLGIVYIGASSLGSPTLLYRTKDIKPAEIGVLDLILAYLWIFEAIERDNATNMAPVTFIVDVGGEKLGRHLKPAIALKEAKMRMRSLNLFPVLYPRRLNYLGVFCKGTGLTAAVVRAVSPFKALAWHSHILDGGKDYRALQLMFDEADIPREYGGTREWGVNECIEAWRSEGVLGDAYSLDEAILRKYPKKERGKYQRHTEEEHRSPEEHHSPVEHHSPAVSPA